MKISKRCLKKFHYKSFIERNIERKIKYTRDNRLQIESIQMLKFLTQDTIQC